MIENIKTRSLTGCLIFDIAVDVIRAQGLLPRFVAACR